MSTTTTTTSATTTTNTTTTTTTTNTTTTAQEIQEEEGSIPAPPAPPAPALAAIGRKMGMNNITEDLGVKFNKGPELLAAPQLSSNASDEEEVMFLSNIDQVVLYPIETVYFYEVKDGGDCGGSSTLGVVDRLRDALLELLVPYSFMAGRLRYNKSLFRLELVLNNAGVLFGGAESSVTLAQVGNPNFPNPGFRDLVLLPQNPTSLADLPLTTIQVTRFKCGSFTIGFSSNHVLVDGIAAGEFLANFAALARGLGMQTWPNPDRTVLKARNPPRVEFDHFEYTWLPGVPFTKQLNPTATYTEADALAAATSRGHGLQNYAYRNFHVDGHMVKLLKQASGVSTTTTFEALAAHLWQCRTAVMKDQEEYSSFLFAVSFRQRIQPPLPKGFAGNAVLCACARAKPAELLSRPLSFAVSKVKEAQLRITDEYVRSAIDCLETNKGIPLSDTALYVSAWWKIIKLQNLDFGWGMPICAGPILSEMVAYVLFVSDGTPDGLNVLLAMPTETLSKFADIFLQPGPNNTFFPYIHQTSDGSILQ